MHEGQPSGAAIREDFPTCGHDGLVNAHLPTTSLYPAASRWCRLLTLSGCFGDSVRYSSCLEVVAQPEDVLGSDPYGPFKNARDCLLAYLLASTLSQPVTAAVGVQTACLSSNSCSSWQRHLANDHMSSWIPSSFQSAYLGCVLVSVSLPAVPRAAHLV